MPKSIDSRMHNIPNYLNTSSSASDSASALDSKKEKFDKIDDLIVGIRRENKDFDLDNWINCNNLKEKTESEIFILLSEQYNKNMIGNKNCLNSIDKSSSSIKSTLSNAGYNTDSLSDFFQEVKKSIIVGKNDYLDVLKSIFSNYMEYVKDLRTAITSMSQYTKGAKKDGNIAINYIEFKKVLEDFKKKFNQKVEGEEFFSIKFLFEHQNNGGYIRELNNQKINYSNESQVNHALNTVEKLLTDIKGIKVVKTVNSPEEKNNIDIDFVANIETHDLDKFISNISTDFSLEGVLSDEEIKKKREKLKYDNTSLLGLVREGFDLDKEMDKIIKENDERKKEAKYKNILQTEFDLFKKSLDALEKKINSNLDELSKKYSSANSNYDNFVKIVSSTMNTLLEMAKGFLRF